MARRRWRPLALTLFALLIGGGLWAGWQWGLARYRGPGPLAAETVLLVPRGTGVQGIADQLSDVGVIRNRWEFLAAVRLRDAAARLRAGEYALPPAISLQGLIDLLASGKTVVRRLTVPEGLTARQVVELLRAESALSGDIGDVPAEGSLLPETYHFSHGDDRAALLARMRKAMADALAELWGGRAPNLPLATPEQALILASIVEKETGVAEERARVAGVFLNRLKLGMRLQSDPTVIYALTGGQGPLERPLTRADWRFESPFNTYVIEGLPPGPIGNPGRESLRAVLHPETHAYLYFVADGTGGHAFAQTLDAHNRNVAQWRKLQQERGDASPN